MTVLTAAQPVSFEVDPIAQLVRVVVTRDPTFPELGAIGVKILCHPDYKIHFDFLADCTAVDEPPTRAYVHSFVAFLQSHREKLPKVRWAQVVQPGAAFGMARMGGMIGAESLSDYRVFTNVGAAERWLAGVPGVG